MHLIYKSFPSSTEFYLKGSFSNLRSIIDPSSTIFITDEHVFEAHKKRFKGRNLIVLKAGEEYKVQATVDAVIEQLLKMQADRATTLIGVGGGVITDLTGYIASVYMRGIRFGFVPTTVLAMVDASIGGKNGIDVDVYKNMLGTIRQPAFILHETSFLDSLPGHEWENGFAEIIKHACIKDRAMFGLLESNTIEHWKKNKKAMRDLVRRNVLLKSRIVSRDVAEKGERRLLNFGHTLGHALENQYELSHGQAISIGMATACRISESMTGFNDAKRVAGLLDRYGLPTEAVYNKKKVFDVMKMDKKRVKKEMNYVLLEKIGKGVIKSIPLKKMEKII